MCTVCALVIVQSPGHMQPFATPWTAELQALYIPPLLTVILLPSKLPKSLAA